MIGAVVKVDSVAKLAAIEKQERVKMKGKVEKILKHDINCFINRQLIYNLPEQMFTNAGIASIEHADFEGIERLALVPLDNNNLRGRVYVCMRVEIESAEGDQYA